MTELANHFNGSRGVIPISSICLQDVPFAPETVYKISFQDIDSLATDLLRILHGKGFHVQGMSVEVFLLCSRSRRVHVQKRAGKNTSRPFVLEVPGGAKEECDKSLHLAALRELLEESGILVLGPHFLEDGFFYFWKHEKGTTGESKWLGGVKC
jgi:hypothetical protein